MHHKNRTPAQERWLKFFNRVLYNTLAPTYDSMDWLTLGAWWRLVRRALACVPPDQIVLEVGCGPGKLHAKLAQDAKLCVGLDRAWGMCRLTDQRLSRAGLHHRMTQGDVLTLPYPANTFDYVVSTFAFSGFPDGDKSLHEILRVMKIGAHIVLVDVGLPEDQNRMGVFFARLWERMGDVLYDYPALLEECDFKNVVCEEYGPGNHIRLIIAEKRSHKM